MEVQNEKEKDMVYFPGLFPEFFYAGLGRRGKVPVSGFYNLFM